MKTETRNAGVTANVDRQHLGDQDIEQRRRGTTLPHTTRKAKERRQLSINIDRTQNPMVKQINPRNERGAKAHSTQSGPHERSVNTVKSLLLTQGKNGHRGARGGGIVSDIPKERNIFAYKPPGDPTCVVLSNNKMDDFEQPPSNTTGSQLIINIKKGNRPLITRVQAITLLKRQ